MHKSLGFKQAAAFVAIATISLTGCSGSDSATETNPTETSVLAGPPVYTEAETNYLDAIYVENLAASVFMSGPAYLEVGNTVCQGLEQGMAISELVSAIATSGEQNGLNEEQRTAYSLVTSAAAITHLCPEQLEALKGS